MIIIHLMGGLGNQMFQYAAGRAVANRCNTTLGLDLSSFESNNLRNYKLNCFNIIEHFVDKSDIKKFKPKKSQPLNFINMKLRKKLLPWYMQKEINQRSYLYDPDILKIRNDAYLNGYWQSEKYFIDIENIIRDEFTFKKEPKKINQNILSEIKNTNSISLHIRRGDYACDFKISQTHGVLDLEYYFKSLDFVYNKIKKPSVFIFSDDIKWVKQNFKIISPCHYIDHNGENEDYEDLQLMSQCKHHIIANSSFSWWGAWLSEYKNKTVIAPNQWFTQKEMMKRGQIDIVPESWIKI